MIDPQIHHGQRGVIGAQHGLQQLTETLAALRQGQTQQGTRETQLQTQLAAVTQAIQRLRWTLAGVGGLVLVLCGLVGWQIRHPPELAYVRAFGALDAAVVQQWPSLPKATQESLGTVYTHMGMVAPGQRK